MSLLNALKNRFDTTEDTTANIPPSDIYAILKNERRRRIIDYLADTDGDESSASDIADHLATMGDERKTAYVSVSQQHLSRMEKSGLIEYNERSKEIRVREELAVVAEVHQVVEEKLD
jgi:DNA-binding transcriptional ArsR family regulator